MEVFNVELRSEEEMKMQYQNTPIVVPIVPKTPNHIGFTLHDANVLRSFRDGIAAFYNGNESPPYDEQDSNRRIIATDACPAKPRIAILNRESTARGRRMPNAQALADAIEEQLYDGTHSVPVIHFSNTSFLEQVSFFSSVDILVATHGAQNTGVGFMPQCGGLMELFPQGIQFGDYFGSLATDSGLEYMQYYVSDATLEEDRQKGHKFKRGLYANDVCPKPEDLFDGLREMVKIWRNCCLDVARSGGH
jgi:hypothetical protein